MKTKYLSDTTAVRAGLRCDRHHNALIPPIHLSSTYALDGLNVKGDYDYSRTANPTRDLLATAIAELEQGDSGVITSSGMAAILLCVQLLSKDDLLVIPHDCYGGSYRLFTNLANRGQFQLLVIDQNNPATLDSALAQKPAMLWLETPSNPLLRIYDIATICKQAHKIGALVAVDNTFLSPILQQPIKLGADMAVHSCTKFINGHSDVVCGAVIAKSAELGEKLRWWANCIGITAPAFDSYLVMRGLRTLPARLKIHEANTHALVDFLQQHEAVTKVWYPKLPEHDCSEDTGHNGHAIAKAQQTGFGSLLSFELKGGTPAARVFLDRLEIFTQAQSLGGVESLVNHPATMTHASMPDEAKLAAGINMSLFRLSVGIEALEDLVADLQQALDAALLS